MAENLPILGLGADSKQPAPSRPVLGWLAVAAAVLGIFTKGYIFVPIAVVLSVAALIMGQAGWAFAGLLLSVVGLLTSPVLLALLGFGALAVYLGMV